MAKKRRRLKKSVRRFLKGSATVLLSTSLSACSSCSNNPVQAYQLAAHALIILRLYRSRLNPVLRRAHWQLREHRQRRPQSRKHLRLRRQLRVKSLVPRLKALKATGSSQTATHLRLSPRRTTHRFARDLRMLIRLTSRRMHARLHGEHGLMARDALGQSPVAL